MNIWNIVVGLILLLIIGWALHQVLENKHSCDRVCSSCHKDCRLKG